MSRVSASVLVLVVALGGCTAPGLDHVSTYGYEHDGNGSSTTADGSSSTTGEDEHASSSSGDEGSSGGMDGSSTSTSSDASTSTTEDTTGAASVCGDAIVDADEECDDGNEVADDGCHACARDRLVFASSQVFTPDLILGLAGADSLCRQLALQSGHPRWTTFVAWMSDSQTSAIDRVTPAPGRYVRPDGVMVAENFARFLSGSIAAPINIDEFGAVVLGSAWTGTRPDGTAAVGHTFCDDWTTSYYLDEEGPAGAVKQTDELWTLRAHAESCAEDNHLYCFEGA
ncbi:DUF4215 domain-containing protein [Nannocystis sp. SCPEA4]|uniref:DUF4215 domain-containing protein n=1 Tax=Nannocystis sp. SCPEA4 TaxID=2996787 RepID=UPI00226D8AE7|nr:DUF4215 domain-containing protein [Nannocystis sp. SCPEA4]MCY1061082.1 DUF4215 domain-containing protein [Nannocystis sp. SCPEA4]